MGRLNNNTQNAKGKEVEELHEKYEDLRKDIYALESCYGLEEDEIARMELNADKIANFQVYGEIRLFKVRAPKCIKARYRTNS